MDTLIERANDIRLLVLDVDGVLTDGRLYFSARGEELKCFHVRDGAGIVHLLTRRHADCRDFGRQSKAVERRMSELGVTWIRQGIEDKLTALRELLDILGLGPQAVASMGDDVADLPIFEVARLAIASRMHIAASNHGLISLLRHWVGRAPCGKCAI